MTTNTHDIDDPLAEFATVPPAAQQEMLKLYAALELMLPEERRTCGATQAGVSNMFEALGIFPLTQRASLSIVRLLTVASVEEKAADERSGL
jgi:hypothetical protein